MYHLDIWLFLCYTVEKWMRFGKCVTQKLYTFCLTDKFKLSMDAIMEEAKCAAERRADMMRWSNVKIVFINKIEGRISTYHFDIYGEGEPLL